MSAANQTIIADIQSLTGDELAEQYRRLADAYRTLKRSHEEELQASYELRRNYQTASESVAYMTAELESIDSVHKDELGEFDGLLYSDSISYLYRVLFSYQVGRKLSTLEDE